MGDVCAFCVSIVVSCGVVHVLTCAWCCAVCCLLSVVCVCVVLRAGDIGREQLSEAVIGYNDIEHAKVRVVVAHCRQARRRVCEEQRRSTNPNGTPSPPHPTYARACT